MTKTRKTKKILKKKRLKLGRVFLVLIILGIIIYVLSKIINFPIRSIFVSNNKYLSDQEVIDQAGISNYPSIFKYSCSQIEKRLKKNNNIAQAKVKKRNLREIDIYVVENVPLFYNASLKKTVLKNGQTTNKEFDSALLINYVPDTIYGKLIKSLGALNLETLASISEIKYDPTDVDKERFLLTMVDGNYAYVTLKYLEKINNYVETMEKVLQKYDNKKGVLYLDEGEYFVVDK